MNYWLMKSEPDTFSIDTLLSLPQKTDYWDGVRNYQARNFLRDQMKKGDLAFFYHSNCDTPGIVGIMKIIEAGSPDPSAFDPKSQYFDPKSSKEAPRWFRVKVQGLEKFKHIIPLSFLKVQPGLEDMVLIRRGNRLSVMPVAPAEWGLILQQTK